MARNPVDDLMAGRGLMELQLQDDNPGAAPSISNSAVLNTDAPMLRVTNGGAVTGIILAPGRKHGQLFLLVNEAAAGGTITFAAAATSNVRDGANLVVPGSRCAWFVFDLPLAQWIGIEGTA